MIAPTHHAPEELLFDYAAGSLPPALSLLVACHITLDPQSRRHVDAYEGLGGALLSDLPPAELSGDALGHVLARIEQSIPALPARQDVAPVDNLPLPCPIRELLGPDLNTLGWRRVAPGVRALKLSSSDGLRPRLLQIDAGVQVPRHTHCGQEFTLVLQGAYQDGDYSFARGDLQQADERVDHNPRVVGDEPCLCMVVTDAPVRFTGRIGRLLNPFLRF